jgi:hypothetical protein
VPAGHASWHQDHAADLDGCPADDDAQGHRHLVQLLAQLHARVLQLVPLVCRQAGGQAVAGGRGQFQEAGEAG